MASPTKKSKIRRALKKAASGTKRKNAERNNGTTAKNLPLNMPNASEQKQAKTKTKTTVKTKTVTKTTRP